MTRQGCERRSICLIFSPSATTSSRMAPSDIARPRRRNRSSSDAVLAGAVDAREDRRPFRDDGLHGRGVGRVHLRAREGQPRVGLGERQLLVAHFDPGVAARARSTHPIGRSRASVLRGRVRIRSAATAPLSSAPL